MRKALAAMIFAMGWVVVSGVPLALIAAAPFGLSGCERDSELEDAAEDVGDEMEDAADDVEDKLD